MNWMLLPYRRYAEFSGRSRRREYWMFALFYVLVFVVLNALFGTNEVTRTSTNFGTGFSYGSRLVGGGGLIGGLFALASLIPALAVSVRRLHDQDRSGWMLLLGLIPFFGGFVLLVFMCLEGTRGANQYGPDPKDPGSAEVFR
ncbi:DUF805 domain-containing protein [Novosphingobium sp. PASSN1]|uniref:DUF805 domain-containing protein n=1 Tax=Novosphingobium sp. PASSN1 TaxID=2015561 RepID=UPI000BD163C4|nr:DUF805 domain-containing protein [Novosphingobium sp. PASSN1]OYU36106.1 MAG: DUF805 domain-containing protein [Novosphingobium sp. PASSN1]